MSNAKIWSIASMIVAISLAFENTPEAPVGVALYVIASLLLWIIGEIRESRRGKEL